MVRNSRLSGMEKKDRILLVEDDSTLAYILADALGREGFEVLYASDGEAGLEAVAMFRPDAVIADVMMPRMSGFEMVRRIRAADPVLPVLFLTARTSVDDLVKGFDSGGNDYLRKPFQIVELVVRVKALLNRVGTFQSADEIIEVSGCRLDVVRQKLTLNGTDLSLSHIETSILSLLFARPNQVVDAETIMMSVWHSDDFGNYNRLHGFIHKLRKYLARSVLDIVNVRSVGYRLVVTRSVE